MKKINIVDVTLKKLLEEREVSLLFREKSAIIQNASLIGVDAIELPCVKNAREDAIVYKTISSNVQNAVLAIPVGFTKESVKTAWECVKSAKNPRLQVEIPVSTIQMEYTYHVKQDKMLEKISELVTEAKSYVSDVEFSALDATRADLDFLLKAVKTAQDCGVTLITVCDDAGVSTPKQIGDIIKSVVSEVTVPVYASVSDRISMGVASAFSAIEQGANGLKCAMVGKNALITGKISDAISVCGVSLNVECNLNNTKIHTSVSDMLSKISHKELATETSVSDKNKILLDSDSSIKDVISCATALGYDLSESDAGKVYTALLTVCEKRGAVGAKEFEALIASNAMQAPSTYHFENYTTTSSNVSTAIAQVTLKRNGEIILGVSSGDGPIDSAFRAIEQCIGHHYELDDFQVQAVTEGKEALGSALVRLRNNGKLYSGNGTSTDIIGASIRAYVNALNKIVAEEA